jgi:hypothetical protein
MARPRDDFPRPAPDVIEDGIPATEEVPEELLRTGEVSEGPMPPLDRPQAVDEWGVTAREQELGEPLDVRLRREQPDRLPRPEDDVRQVYQPGAEYFEDDEPAEVGEFDTLWEDTLSAEEAALRVVEEPPGVTYDDSPGYLEEE